MTNIQRLFIYISSIRHPNFRVTIFCKFLLMVNMYLCIILGFVYETNSIFEAVCCFFVMKINITLVALIPQLTFLRNSLEPWFSLVTPKNTNFRYIGIHIAYLLSSSRSVERETCLRIGHHAKFSILKGHFRPES